MPETSLTNLRNSAEMESHSRVKKITKMNIRCLTRPLASLVLFSVAITSLPVMAEEKSPPNIVIVVLDDAGFSDYSFLGSRIQTPTIDALAANGLTLTNFYVQPRCSPTRAALLTGRNPHSVGLGFLTVPAHVEPTNGPYQGYLDPDSTTVAEALKGAGYKSYLAGKWHLGERPESWPLAHGFDDYFGLISGASSYFELITDQPMVRTMARGMEEWTPAGDNFYMTDATTEFAVERLKKHQTDHPSKPFFLTLSYKAVHYPFQPAPRHKGRYADKPIEYPETMANTERNYRTQPNWVRERDREIARSQDQQCDYKLQQQRSAIYSTIHTYGMGSFLKQPTHLVIRLRSL